MTVEEFIFATFATVFQDRLRPIFPQGDAPIPTPSGRYIVIGGTIDADICGVGVEATDDISFQLDTVSATAAARMSLRTAVRAAAAGAAPPMVLRAPPTQQYDIETKTYRETFEFTVYGSD